MRVFGRIAGPSFRSLSFALLAATTFASACEDKKPVPVTVESAKPAPPPTPVRGLAELTAPPDVVVFGGIEDVGKLADPLSTMAASATRAPIQLRAQLPKIVAETLGLNSAEAIDFTKPVRVAILDPKKHVRGFGVFMLHVKDENALVSTTPPTRALNDQGNAYGWDIQGGRIYLNMVGDVAVFTMEPGTFGELQGFLKELAVSTAPPGATFVAPMGNVVALYKGDFDGALAALKAQQQSLTGAAAQSFANVVRVDEGMFALASELDSLTMSLRPSDDGLVLCYALAPRAGTPLEATLKSLKGKADNPLLARFPKAAAAYFTASLAPESMQSMRSALEWMLGLSLPPDQATKFVGAWSDLIAASTGDLVIGAYRREKGLAVAAMSGVSDADKARAAQAKMLAMYEDPAMKDAMEKMGVTATVKQKAYKIGDVDVSVTKSEMKAAPPGAQAALAAMSPLMEAHSAVLKDAAIIAYGTDAKDTLRTLVDPKAGKDAPELGLDKGVGVARALKNGAPNPFLHAYISPTMLAQADPAGGADASGIVLTAGTKNGILEIDVDVPTAQIGPAVMALGALRGLGRPTDATPPAPPAPKK